MENTPFSSESAAPEPHAGYPEADSVQAAAHIGMPSIELLGRLHTFPGTYMFKAIGHGNDGFAERVVAAVRDELAENADPPFRVRHTGSGRHVSVTLEPKVESVEQVLAVYRRICRTSGLVMLW